MRNIVGSIKMLAAGSVVLLSFALLPVSGFAAGNAEQAAHDMGGMPGHDMRAMAPEEHGAHAAGSMVTEDHGGIEHAGHEAEKTKQDNQWPVLYGFGGAMLAVVTIAGIRKMLCLRGQEVK